MKLKILIMGSCTNKKYIKKNVLGQKQLDNASLEEIKQIHPKLVYLKAIKMYQGQQNIFIKDALKILRKNFDVDYYILSAGFGIISENDKIPAYNSTFQGKSRKYIKKRSKTLMIAETFTGILQNNDWDIIIFALGKDYLYSLGIENSLLEKNYCKKPIKIFLTDLKHAENYKNTITIKMNSKYSSSLKKAGIRSSGVVNLKGLFILYFAKVLSKFKEKNPNRITKLKENPDIIKKIMIPENLRKMLFSRQKKLF